MAIYHIYVKPGSRARARARNRGDCPVRSSRSNTQLRLTVSCTHGRCKISVMAYSLFYAPTPSVKMPESNQLISVEFDAMGAAITAACKLIREGASVWQLHGAYGLMMERGDIETECDRRESRNS